MNQRLAEQWRHVWRTKYRARPTKFKPSTETQENTNQCEMCDCYFDDEPIIIVNGPRKVSVCSDDCADDCRDEINFWRENDRNNVEMWGTDYDSWD